VKPHRFLLPNTASAAVCAGYFSRQTLSSD